jgi:predicted ribonuclease YlaK
VPVVLVSKDINLRIKALDRRHAGEDYENDRALDDFSLLYTGAHRTARRILEQARQGPALLEREEATPSTK